ncbi:MAG: arginine--tRNA ligase, partial [Clostridia bacterium]|nr:arginine--tRNA ligase [Clostridia bacterium]
MLTFKKQIASALFATVKETFPAATLTEDTLLDMLEYPPDPAMGDLALPCFKLSKELRRSPMQIADMLCAAYAPVGECERAESVKGYLNFYLNRAAFAR